MNDWQQLALAAVFLLLVGLPLRFYVRRRHAMHVERTRDVGRALTWVYGAAGCLFFVALALSSRDNTPRLILFSVFAGMQFVMAARRFSRQRSTYGIRHLLLAMTFAAVLAASGNWFELSLTTTLGVSAGTAIFLLYALEWYRQRPVAPELQERESQQRESQERQR